MNAVAVVVKKLKAVVAKLNRQIAVGVRNARKYILELIDTENKLNQLEVIVKISVKISLEKAQEIVGDREAIKRGYVSQEIIDDAYSLASDLKKQRWFEPGIEIGQPYQFYLKSAVFAALDKKWKDSRRFASVCKIASFVAAN